MLHFSDVVWYLDCSLEQIGLIILIICKYIVEEAVEVKHGLFSDTIFIFSKPKKRTMDSSLTVSLSVSKLVHSYMRRLMSAARSRVMFSRSGEQVSVLHRHGKTLPRPEEAPTCVCPAVSLVQDEIIHQNCPEETLWGKVQRHANDKSMFAEKRKTVSSEWIGNGRTEVRPFQTLLYLCVIHVEGLQMSKRNWWFCSTWCKHYVVFSWLLWISSVQFCYGAASWTFKYEKCWRQYVSYLQSLSRCNAII